MARSSKKRGSTVRIPGMAGVEGKRATVPEGEYSVAVSGVEEKDGKNAPYLAWEMTINDGDHEKSKLFYNTSLAPQALWNLRGLLEAMDIDPPDDEEDMDVDDFVGKEFMVNVEHEKYEGKAQARIVDFWPLEKKAAKKSSAKSTPADDDDADDKPAAKGKAVESDDDDADDKAARRRERRQARKEKASGDVPSKPVANKAKLAKLSEDEVGGMDEEALADVLKDYSLDVDLDEFATLRKKRAAVMSALEDGGHLED